jgi:hypothetical protein
MESMLCKRNWRRLICFSVAAFSSICTTAVAGQIEFLAPLANTVVIPGQTVSVSVTRSQDVNSVVLTGDLLSLVGGTTAPESGANPIVFSITIPKDIAPGAYRLGALQADGVASPVASAPLGLIVNPGGSVASLGITPGVINLRYPGDGYKIRVFSTQSDGSTVQLTDATTLTLTVSDPLIAAVHPGGRILALKPGMTTINAQYQGQKASVTVNVPLLKEGDLNGDGIIDTDDLNILDSYLNRSANGPNDSRDLNHDGKIDALDARILITLCTYPRCASHP